MGTLQIHKINIKLVRRTTTQNVNMVETLNRKKPKETLNLRREITAQQLIFTPKQLRYNLASKFSQIEQHRTLR